MSERKAIIKNADMSDDMQTDAIDCAVSVRSLPKPCQDPAIRFKHVAFHASCTHPRPLMLARVDAQCKPPRAAQGVVQQDKMFPPPRRGRAGDAHSFMPYVIVGCTRVVKI